MVLKGYEWGILRDLIGKKAEAIIIPSSPNTVSQPVQVILLMSNQKGIAIDSCFRTQKPTEIHEEYPQLRIRVLNDLPNYWQSQRIELGQDGEIVRRVQLVNEEVNGYSGNVEYSRAIHINFTEDKELAVIRDSYHTPGLDLCTDSNWISKLGDPVKFRQIITL